MAGTLGPARLRWIKANAREPASIGNDTVQSQNRLGSGDVTGGNATSEEAIEAMIRYRLNEEGIFPLTRWELDGRAIRPYALEEAEETRPDMAAASRSAAPPKAWIYAFVVGNRVMFLGATGQDIKTRLDAFETSHHPASMRIREHIRKALMEGKEVEICARPGPDPDTLRREADDLTDELDPPWNRVPPRRESERQGG